MSDVKLVEQLRAAGIESQQGAAAILDARAIQQRVDGAVTAERVRGEGIVLAMADSLRIELRKDASKAVLREAIIDLDNKLDVLKENVSLLWGVAEAGEEEASSDG